MDYLEYKLDKKLSFISSKLISAFAPWLIMSRETWGLPSSLRFVLQTKSIYMMLIANKLSNILTETIRVNECCCLVFVVIIDLLRYTKI